MSHRSRINRMIFQLDHLDTWIMPALRHAPSVLHRHAPTGRIASPNWNAGSRGSDATSTTERHALNPDAETRAIEAVFTSWTHMIAAIDKCVKAIHALDATATPEQADPGKLRASTLPPPCEDCGETDAVIKAGYCRACYQAWYRAGRPIDRVQYLARRRKNREGVPVPANTNNTPTTTK